MALITLNRIERRRMTVFLSCLIVAILTWLLIALSGRYIYKVDSKINYVDPPDSKAYHPLQDDSISLQIEGTGWQLLFSRLRLNPQTVNVSLKSLNSRNYVVFSNQLNEINRQFESNQRIISISPDTLFFDFSRRSVKKVPIKLSYELSFIRNYGISGPIRLTPSKVILNGAAEDLKRIDFWPTSLLKRTNVSSNITARLSFASSRSNNLDVYPLSVKVDIPVDKFTEKVIEVPIKVMNTKGRAIRLLPEKVKITILTALSNYPQIERDSLLAVVDLDNWRETGSPQLPIVLKKFPKYCKLVKIEPQVVDFFVKE